MKIRTKLLVTMIPLVSISIAIISFIALANFARTIQSEIVNELEIVTANLMDKLSRVMFERVADVKFLSTGNVLSNPNFTIPQKVEYLRDMERTFKTYASISVYAINGTKIGDTRNILLGSNESEKPFFEHALKGEVYHDNTPVMSESLRQYVIHFSAPLYDAEGKINGVIATQYPINKLHDIFKFPQQEVDQGQANNNLNNEKLALQIDLVSSNGLILYSNHDRKSILTKNISDLAHFQQIKRPGSETALTSLDSQAAIFIGLGQGKGYLDYKGSGWFLITTERSEEVFAGLQVLINQFVIISASIMVVAILIVFIIASRISKPIMQFRRAALDLSNGKYDNPINTLTLNRNGNNRSTGNRHYTGELGELASTLEIMRQNVNNVNCNLNALVFSRTKQLETSNEMLKTKELQLEKANLNLIAADRAKEEFMSMVSHELKSPLSPMKLYTEMLLKPLSLGSSATKSVNIIEKQKKGLKIIHNNILQLERLVSDILDVYKLDIGTLNLHKTDVNISELVDDNVAELMPLTNDKQIQLVAETQLVSGVAVWCDKQRITQVISNLVRNSIDFVPEKTGRIIIRAGIYNSENSNDKTEKGREKKEMALFTIEDNGIGISRDKIDSLFKKFYQLDTGLTRKHGGTGLGLSICKGIIEAHGGKIWIDKEYTNGTSVKFTLPVRMNTTKENENEKKNAKEEL
ncbi:hybrid sensor histidine kinase/response regulator [soil metagenome]